MSSKAAVNELVDAEDLMSQAHRKMIRVSKRFPGVEGGYPLKNVIALLEFARVNVMLVKSEYEEEGTDGT